MATRRRDERLAVEVLHAPRGGSSADRGAERAGSACCALPSAQRDPDHSEGSISLGEMSGPAVVHVATVKSAK